MVEIRHERLKKNRPYLKDTINKLKNSGTWKIKLKIVITFIIEFFNSLKNRYQNDLESMKDSEFVSDYVHLLYYKCREINSNRGGSEKKQK